MRYNTKIYGHRGASRYAPENSVEAFQLAYDMGADGIEFDVQMTKDGHLVVCHDEEISRVSDGRGYIKDYTLEELRKFRFNKTHPEYENVKIPLLEEVLERFAQKKSSFLFNIELKNSIFVYEGLEKEVLKLVRAKNVLERTLFSSFYHKSMLMLREMEPEARVAFLYCDGIIDIADYAEKYEIDIIHPVWYLLDREDMLTSLNHKGIEVNVWTVDSGKEIRRLCDMGVDGIITNRPDLGSEIRDDRREVYK
ncbi:MAG: glycerophosphodiester phosphodiesterase [Hungatella sp.]|jgi:glycerophosphoryl diester phosphodiesterase|nr:glycerophosphodiester phosphodiesterase [Hungatella sp.]